MKTAVFDEDLPRRRVEPRPWEFFANLKPSKDRKFTLLERALPDGPPLWELFGGSN